MSSIRGTLSRSRCTYVARGWTNHCHGRQYRLVNGKWTTNGVPLERTEQSVVISRSSLFGRGVSTDAKDYEVDPITMKRVPRASYPHRVLWEEPDSAGINNAQQETVVQYQKETESPPQEVQQPPIDRHGYTTAPQGMQTYNRESAEELEQNILHTGEEQRASVDRHGYTTAPQGLETQFDKESASGLEGDIVQSGVSSAASQPKAQVPKSQEQGTVKGSIQKDRTQTDSLKPDTDPDTFKILSLENGNVVSSEIKYSSTRTLSQTLARLDNPTKFLPHIEQLNADGWEIVVADKDRLIFKKARSSRLKRVLAVGLGAAGLSYAIGVGSELVR